MRVERSVLLYCCIVEFNEKCNPDQLNSMHAWHCQWVNSATLTGHTGGIDTVGCMRTPSITSETDLIATGSGDGTIRIWERRVLDDEKGALNGVFDGGAFVNVRFCSLNLTLTLCVCI